MCDGRGEKKKHLAGGSKSRARDVPKKTREEK